MKLNDLPMAGGKHQHDSTDVDGGSLIQFRHFPPEINRNTQYPVNQGVDENPHEVLSRLEDIFLRLIGHGFICNVHQNESGTNSVILKITKPQGEEGADLLRMLSIALDEQSYCWRCDGRNYCFTDGVHCVDENCAISFLPMDRVRLWPDGETLACVLRDMCMRLSGLANSVN